MFGKKYNINNSKKTSTGSSKHTTLTNEPTYTKLTQEELTKREANPSFVTLENLHVKKRKIKEEAAKNRQDNLGLIYDESFDQACSQKYQKIKKEIKSFK